jgi:hypothetical protein
MVCFIVSNILDIIRAHFWRACTLALLVLLALQWVQATKLEGDLAQARAALSIATDAVDVTNDMRAAAEESAQKWEDTAQDLRSRLVAELDKARIQRDRDAAAVAAARAAERDADSTLRLWMDRYAASVREPSCRAQMEQPLCVALD